MDGVIIDDEAKSLFWDYFNVADEVWESVTRRMDQSQSGGGTMTDEWPLTLADLDDRFVARAKEASQLFGFSWPPYLPEAEEYLLDHRKELD